MPRFNNSDKGAIGHSIVHRTLWEYLQSLDWDSSIDVEEKDRRRREIFERYASTIRLRVLHHGAHIVRVVKSCQELVAEMVHTKDGSRAVREFLAQGTAKVRTPSCICLPDVRDDTGPRIGNKLSRCSSPTLSVCAATKKLNWCYLLLWMSLSMLNCPRVYCGPDELSSDTKLVAKSFISEITSRASSFVLPPTSSQASNHSINLTAARRVILYLLIPRSSRYFPPSLTSILAATDEARSRTSRKDMNVRMKEVREAASDDLIQLVNGKADEMLRDPAASLVLSEIMLHAEGGMYWRFPVTSNSTKSRLYCDRQVEGRRHAACICLETLPYQPFAPGGRRAHSPY